MTEQAARDTILKKTLQVLVQRVGLTPDETVQLRLSDLHLAGKNPQIIFTPAGSDKPKTVELDLEAHRALVGWLVARPDSKSEFLFPDSGDAAMSAHEVERRVEGTAGDEAPAPEDEATGTKEKKSRSEAEPPSPAREPAVGDARPTPPPARPMPPPPSRPMAPVSRPEPPPSRPEMGSSSVGTDPTMASFRPPPPPSAPEGEKSVNIPLPTTAPKPPSSPATESGPDETAGSGAEVPAAATEGEKPEATTPPAAAGKPGSPAQKQPVHGGVRPDDKAAKIDDKAGIADSLTAEQAAAKAAAADQETSLMSRLVVSGSVVMIVFACVACLGGGWLAAQSGPGQALLASVGWSSASTPAADLIEATQETGTDVVNSPLPTPTLPPTSTPTELPTNTPAPPTETPTPVPTNTSAPQPTNTPAPTDTPVPTDTPAPSEPTETPEPEETPTPGMTYGAPVLMEPKNNFEFIQGNTIILRWESVGELAPDEQYAVRMVYNYQNQPTYQGANIKETEWQVPLSLFGQVDGPDNLYEWYVVVERLNDDGSGTAISPESEKRRFTWR